MEIDIGRLFKAVLKRSWIIVLAAIIAGALSYLYSTYKITPMYTASISLYVQNRSVYQGNISSGDLASAGVLAETISALLVSDRIMGVVAEKMGGDVSANRLSSMVRTSVSSDTGVMFILVSSTDPYFAQEVANAIGDYAPDEIMKFISAGNVQLIDSASVPYVPSSPNIMQNTTLAFAAVLLLGCVLFAFLEMIDTRIKSEDDIKHITDLAIIGVIPNMTKNLYPEDKTGVKKK